MKTNEKRKAVTILYFVLSVLLIVTGISLFFAAFSTSGELREVLKGIGFGLIPSGLVQIVFGIVYIFDNNHSALVTAEIESRIDNLTKTLSDEFFNDGIWENTLKEPVQRQINSIGKNDKLTIDIMGLTLHNFLKEQLLNFESKIKMNPNCHIRMIVQNTEKNNAAYIFKAEGKDLDEAKNRIKELENVVKRITEDKNCKCKIELKYFGRYPTQTLTIVNGVAYCHVRNFSSSQSGTKFFEVYKDFINQKKFDFQQDFFNTAWEKSTESKTVENIERE